MRDVLIACAVAFICAPLSIMSFGHVAAQVMGSSNYRIQSDSVNVGGGLSTSSTYTLESTAGEIATGESASGSFRLKAGYQQMHEVYLAMSSAADVTMSPSLGGITGGTSYGTTTTTVTTDSAAGYTLSIQASASPAMQSDASSIADYVPAGAAPDFTFATAATDAHFAYSPEGADTAQRFRDNGSACNTGSGNVSGSCWDGLATTPVAIATASNGNHPSGTTTTVLFRVGIGSSVNQLAGTYVATTTLTALPL